MGWAETLLQRVRANSTSIAMCAQIPGLPSRSKLRRVWLSKQYERSRVKAEPEMGKRLGIMRQWIVDQAGDPTWGMLMLEFKKYAVRRPDAKESLLKLDDELFGSAWRTAGPSD